MGRCLLLVVFIVRKQPHPYWLSLATLQYYELICFPLRRGLAFADCGRRVCVSVSGCSWPELSRRRTCKPSSSRRDDRPKDSIQCGAETAGVQDCQRFPLPVPGRRSAGDSTQSSRGAVTAVSFPTAAVRPTVQFSCPANCPANSNWPIESNCPPEPSSRFKRRRPESLLCPAKPSCPVKPNCPATPCKLSSRAKLSSQVELCSPAVQLR